MPAQVTQFGDGDTQHTEHYRQLSAVMQVVRQDAPDRSLVRNGVSFPVIGVIDLLSIGPICNFDSLVGQEARHQVSKRLFSIVPALIAHQ